MNGEIIVNTQEMMKVLKKETKRRMTGLNLCLLLSMFSLNPLALLLTYHNN